MRIYINTPDCSGAERSEGTEAFTLEPRKAGSPKGRPKKIPTENILRGMFSLGKVYSPRAVACSTCVGFL